MASAHISGPSSHSVQTVSVLIAAYNAAEFIGRAIESALNQTLKPLEVLVVNDGSTDNTSAVVARYAAINSAVREVLLTSNKGPATARNVGIDVALGDWVAVLDADDAYKPDRLRELLDTAVTTAADAVTDTFYYYDSRTGATKVAPFHSSAVPEVISRYTFVAQARPNAKEADWGLLKPMFRRAFLNTHALRYPAHSRHGEDFLFVLEILLRGGRYVLHRNPGYLYTLRSGGLSRTKIDYESMAEQSAALMARADIAQDARLVFLLRRRIAAVKQLSAEHRARRHALKGNYARLFFSMLMSWRVSIAVLRQVKRKMSRSF